MRVRGQRIVLFFCLLSVLFLTDFLGAQTITVKVISQSAYVRLKPSIESMIISQVPLGAVLEAPAKIEDWYKVSLPPDAQGIVVQGYIHSTDIEVVVAEKTVMTQASPTVHKVQAKKPAAKEVEQVYRPIRESNVQFGLKLMGGGDYFQIGDMNDYLQGRQDYIDDAKNITDFVGSYEPLKYGYSFGAELFVDFTPHIGIGIGVGYFQVEKKNEVDITYDYVVSVDNPDFFNIVETIFPQISAIPMTFSLNFGLPMGSAVKLRLSVGIGYYFGTVVWDYLMETNNSETKMDWETKTNAVGFHGRLGLDFNLGKTIVFFIEGFGRYVQFEDLSGNLTVKEIWNGEVDNEDHENAFLKYLEYNSYLTDEWYPLVSIDEEGVLGSGYNNVPLFNSTRNLRNAVIDLTGVSVRTGFKIKF